MSMLAMDRRNLILDRVQQLSSVRVGDLAEEFGVTEETIRRDLEKLEEEGYVTRTYGGAVLVQTGTADLSIAKLATLNLDYDGTATFKTLNVGGRERGAGTYSAANGPKAVRNVLGGEGVLQILEGNEPGTVLLIR